MISTVDTQASTGRTHKRSSGLGRLPVFTVALNGMSLVRKQVSMSLRFLSPLYFFRSSLNFSTISACVAGLASSAFSSDEAALEDLFFGLLLCAFFAQ